MIAINKMESKAVIKLISELTECDVDLVGCYDGTINTYIDSTCYTVRRRPEFTTISVCNNNGEYVGTSINISDYSTIEIS